jgi:flagellar protein FliS
MSNGYTANSAQEYLKNAVMTAPPEQLQLMLYDGAIRFALRGQEAIRAKQREASFEALERAQKIVLELASGLRPEVNPQLAEQMAALYNFIYHRLVDGNVQQDEQAVEDALRILRHQRETWLLVLEKLKQEAQQAEQPTEAPQSASPASSYQPKRTPGPQEPSPSLNTEG